MFFTLFFFVPILANGAHVYIWNYDPLDTFYDSEVGSMVDCTYWLEQTLNANGHTYDKSTSLSSTLNGYAAVFVTLGWYRC